MSHYKNGKSLKYGDRRYSIEVIQCSGEEMNMVLMGILPSNLINMQIPNAPLNLPIPHASRNFLIYLSFIHDLIKCNSEIIFFIFYQFQSKNHFI